MYWLYKLLSPISRIWIHRVEGLQNVPSGPIIFTPNHPSYLDGVLLFYTINWKLKRHIHFFTWNLWWSFIYIPIIHGITMGGAVEKGVETIKKGISLGIFPEGRRTFGKPRPYKTGAATVALLTGKPIVPIGIKYHSQKALRWKATIKFGKPISVKKQQMQIIPLKKRQELTKKIRNEIIKLSR